MHVRSGCTTEFYQLKYCRQEEVLCYICGMAFSLFSQLRRRGVLRTAAAYLAVAWLSLQVIDTVGGIISIPDWLALYTLVGLIIGFPIAVFLAWAYELTPEGIRAAAASDAAKPMARFGGRKIDFVIIGALSLVIALLLVKDNLVLTNPPSVGEIPMVSNYQQLTTSQVVFPPYLSPYPLVADASRLFFNTYEAGKLPVKQLARAGGEPVPFANLEEEQGLVMRPSNLTPDRSNLLMTLWQPGDPGRLETWLFPIVGGAARMLGQGINPSYSNDGSRIAYMGDQNHLHIASAQMLDSRTLLSADGHIHWIQFSPDDELLRYTVGDVSPRIWEVSVDGSNVHPMLPEWQNIDHCCGNWVDDGKYYVFQATHNQHTQLWALNEAGNSKSEPVQITTGALEFRRPTVVDNGKTIFAIGWQLRGEVVRYDRNADGFLPLPGFESVSAEHLSYSRDGAVVAYIDHPAANLWRSNRDGSNRTQLTFTPMKVLYPVVSPDGQHIVFAGYLPDGNDKIFIVSTSGGPYRPLTPTDTYEESPTWSPDSTQIAFSIDDEPSIQLYDVASGTVASMPLTEGLWGPDWSPDGKSITAMDSAENLVRLDVESGRRTEIENVSPSYGVYYWDADSEHIVFIDSESRLEERAVHRMRLADGMTEKVASVGHMRGVYGALGIWVGIDPDGAPLMLRDIGIHHIYALDWLP